MQNQAACAQRSIGATVLNARETYFRIEVTVLKIPIQRCTKVLMARTTLPANGVTHA
jgi:hypothetical protein